MSSHCLIKTKLNPMESKPKDDLSTAQVQFSIQYKTDYGEQLFIVGSSQALGLWKCPLPLKWTPGHIWKIKLSLSSNELVEYKYKVEGYSQVRWEEGPNRCLWIAPKTTSLNVDDIWEHYRIRFSLNYKLPPNPNKWMRINGNCEALGEWLKPVKMQLRSSQGRAGVLEEVWSHEAVVPTKHRYLEYKYSIYDSKSEGAVWEREPTRVLRVASHPPSTFASELGISGSEVKSDIHGGELVPVNGIIDRFDVNFVANMEFQKIEPYPVFIGPYPQTEADIQKLEAHGITAVFNLQTERDMTHRQVQWDQKLKIYEAKKIKAVHYPIHDFNQEAIVERIGGAADEINALLEDGRVVYIHCTAGMSRAPGSFLVYLYKYKGVEIDDGLAMVRKFRPIVAPNIKALKIAVNQ